MRDLNIAVACAASVCVLGLAAAASAHVVSPDWPTVRTYKGVNYITGGVSPNDREVVEVRAAGDNLELRLALGGQAYLGRARVSITDTLGHPVLEATSRGPLLFTRLVPGNYLVSATAEGVSESKMMTIPRDGRAIANFAWTESVQPAA